MSRETIVKRLVKRTHYSPLLSLEGFTLVEILIVIALMMILVTIAIPSYLGSAKVSRLREGTGTLSTFRIVEAVYYSKNNRYGDFTDLADEAGLIDDRFSGGGSVGPIEVNKITYLFSASPTGENYEITAITVYGDVVKLTVDGRIVKVED